MNKQQTGLTAISDVTETAVRELLAAHDWPTLVHGHTHRPAHHLHDASSRWVIQDWHDDHGGYLRLDEQGIAQLPLS